MKRQNVEGGTWFDKNSATSWDEATRWNGNNHISVATGSQFDHERLYRTAKGAWVLYSWSQWQGSAETWVAITAEQAYAWLLHNEHHYDVPDPVMAKAEI